MSLTTRVTVLVIVLCLAPMANDYLLALGELPPTNATKDLATISPRNQQYLEIVLRVLFVNDDFSFTLFGNKPMSFNGLGFSSTNQLPTGRPFSRRSLSVVEACRIFEKWASSLSSTNYCFVLNKGTDGLTMVYFINKYAFLKAVGDNIDIFQEELGPDITPEKLLENFRQGNQSVFEILKYREGLLGILLGYGRHNSMLFQRREDIEGPLSGYDGRIAHPSYHLTKHPKDVSSYQQELDTIEERLVGFSDMFIDPVLTPICVPGFCVEKDHEETKALEREYSQTLSRILDAYSKQPLLQAILEQIYRPDPDKATVVSR